MTDRVSQLAGELDVAAVSAEVTRAILDEVFGDLSDDAAFGRAVLVSVQDNIENILQVIAGRPVARTEPHAGALAFAEAAAAARVDARSFERSYRVGQNAFWSAWFAQASARAHSAGVPVGEYIEQPSARLFAYIDHILRPVLDHFEAVSREMLRTRDNLRETLLPRLLDGSIDQATRALDEALGYPLDGHHLFLLLRTDDGSRPQAAIGAATDALGTPRVLVARDRGLEWGAWFGQSERFAPPELRRLDRALRATSLGVSVGDPETGLAGFRAVRDAARAAAHVQHALGVEADAVTWAQDVRLEALLLGDPEAARRFVAAELGPLCGGDPRADRLRRTLLVWLSAGSHVSAAAALGVHEKSVRNRMREIEGSLERPVAQRRAELLVALRLHRVLGGGPAGT